MARFNVGEAFLQVVASAKGIHEAISAEVAKIKDIQIDVTPNLDGFRDKIAAEVAGIADVEIDVTPNLTGFREKVAAETARLADVDVNVKPDTTGFKEKVQAGIRGIGSMDVPITVDTTRANAQVGAFTTELRARLEAATKALGDIRFSADSSDVERKIAAIRAQLVTLANQRIGVDIDSAAASAKITALEAELTALGAKSPNIQVKVDVAKATAELAAFRAVVNGVGNDGNLVSRALGGFVTAIGSVLGSLGSFVGSASSVGSALTSMGGSVTGAAGSFAALGQNIGGVLSSALPFLATAAQWTAMGIAIAGAGAIAVGGIGQLGGAVVALASGIVPLVTSLGLLPGLLAPLGIGLATLAIGFSNTGKSGMEFKQTMDQLKTAFTPVIDSIRSQMQPAIQTFIKSVSSLAPVIQSVLPQITAAVSQVTNSFSAMFRSSSFQSDLKTLLSGAATNIKTFGDAAKNAFQGFLNIMVAAQPAVNRIATDIDQAAQKFNAWTAAARQSGELTTIFQQAATVLEQLGNTVVNIAGLFKDLWDSANRTGAFTGTLAAINTGITQFRDYVTQAGGAWDQLMSKAASVTTSLVGLVGSIGNAFVTLGNSIDISGVIDTITAAINNMTPAFAQIGAAATPVFENIITIIGRMVQALGPTVSGAITQLGAALKAIDWEGVTEAIATFIKGLGDIVSTISTVGQAFNTFETLLNQVMSGDFTGAAQSLQHLNDLWTDLGTTLTDRSGIDAAKNSVKGLNDAINGVQQPPPIVFNADGSPVQSTAGQVQGWIQGVSGDWNTTFTGDAGSLLTIVQSAATAISGLPQTHTTTFTGDGAALLTAAAGGQSAITGVVPDWLTKFAGDTSNLITAAATSADALNGVPSTHGSSFTGDASGLTSAATSGTTAINGVPTTHDTTFTGTADAATGGLLTVVQSAATAISGLVATHATTITGDNSNLTAAAQGATTALNGIVDKAVTITANNSQALSAIQQVQSQLNSLQDKTVTVTVQTVQAGAGGMIVNGMAGGGILPMASGGHLTPMSGGTARVVGPNTWRVIGDRPHGDEAFIPLNGSAASTALLGVAAQRSGFGLVPMHSGGFSSRDGRAWNWLEELLRRYRHGHGGGGGSGPPKTPTTIGTASMQRIASSLAFGGAGGTASYMRNVLAPETQILQPSPTVPSPPSRGGGHNGGHGGYDAPRTVRVDSNSALVQEVMRLIRSEVRKQGGDVQFALGA